MKLQAIKALKRGLALLCISMLVLGLLPPQTKARAGEYQFSVFDAGKVGMRVYPGDEIRDDYDNTTNPEHKAYLDFTVDGKVVRSLTLDYTSVETAPFFDGVEYWEVVSSISNGATENQTWSTTTVFYGTSGNNNNDTSRVDPGTIQDTPNEVQYFDYWEDVVANNAMIDFGNFNVTDNLAPNNNEQTNENWIQGNPIEKVEFQVAEANTNITATPTPVFDDGRGQQNPDDDQQIRPIPNNPTPEPTATPTPTSTPTPTATPVPTATPIPQEDQNGQPNPDDTPTPEPTATPVPTSTPTPVPTSTPTPLPTATPVPTATPIPTAVPTRVPIASPTPIPVPRVVTTPIPTPIPVVQTYIPPVPTGPVQVIAQVKEPEHVVYNVDLEVGRYAKITPKYARNDTHKSSNTKIILDPRSAVGSFSASDFEARAMWPGDAQLTFKTNSENYTEDWNVHVYCRPLDFEKTQYVVNTPKDRDGYITLFLKNFEYSYEYAYDFEWHTSEDGKKKGDEILYLAGGTKTTTYARFCVRKGKEGAVIVTVKDKYGNSSQAVIIVKPEKTASSGDKEKDNGKNSGNNSDNENGNKIVEFNSLSKKKAKALVANSKFDTGLEIKNGKIVFTWTPYPDKDLGGFDGYEVQYSSTKNKFKSKNTKTIEKAKTVIFTYKSAKNKKTYYFRVRGYKLWFGKKLYSDWSAVDKIKFKK